MFNAVKARLMAMIGLSIAASSFMPAHVAPVRENGVRNRNNSADKRVATIRRISKWRRKNRAARASRVYNMRRA